MSNYLLKKFALSIFIINFAAAKKRRKVGRVIDRAGLEIRYTPFGYRGFESLTFRKYLKESHLALFFLYN